MESDVHYIAFLEALKNEENDGSRGENKLEYSYQLKEEKKITTTPLLDYLANKKNERKEEKRKKIDDRKKNREDEKQKKRISIVKNIPPSIKEEDKVMLAVLVCSSNIKLYFSCCRKMKLLFV